MDGQYATKRFSFWMKRFWRKQGLSFFIALHTSKKNWDWLSGKTKTSRKHNPRIMKRVVGVLYFVMTRLIWAWRPYHFQIGRNQWKFSFPTLSRRIEFLWSLFFHVVIHVDCQQRLWLVPRLAPHVWVEPWLADLSWGCSGELKGTWLESDGAFHISLVPKTLLMFCLVHSDVPVLWQTAFLYLALVHKPLLPHFPSVRDHVLPSQNCAGKSTTGGLCLKDVSFLIISL